MNNLAEKKEAAAVPKVWIGCLAAYNSGRLHGEWVDIPEDAEDLKEEIKRVLSKSPEPFADEWAFMDYEYVPERFGENPDLEKLCEYASLYNEHGEAVNAFVSINGADYLDEFEEHFMGCWDSFRQFAEEQAEQEIECLVNKDAQQFVFNNFDYCGYEIDLEHSYTHEEGNGGCYVFIR